MLHNTTDDRVQQATTRIDDMSSMSPIKDDTQKRPKPGPDAERLALNGDWKDATKKALAKERPPEGWPSPEEMQAKEKGQDKSDE